MTPSSETNSVTTILPLTLPSLFDSPGPAPAVSVYTNGPGPIRHPHRKFLSEQTALATVAANRTSGVLSGTVATPGHPAPALTDGYALAFSVTTVLLVATAIVALATLPGRRSQVGSPTRVEATPLEPAVEAEPVALDSSSNSNSSRPRRAAGSAGRILDLLHEFETDAAGSLHESDPARAERAADRPRSPQDLVACQLGVEIVHEEGGVQEPLVRQHTGVLVDRLGEQCQGKRTELDVGSAPVLPLPRFGHGRSGRLIPGTRLLEVDDLHGQIGQPRDGHQCSGVPYSEPRSSAMSSRRTPSGSEKYSEISLSICVAMPASSRRARAASHCARSTEMARWWKPPSTSAYGLRPRSGKSKKASVLSCPRSKNRWV